MKGHLFTNLLLKIYGGAIQIDGVWVPNRGGILMYAWFYIMPIAGWIDYILISAMRWLGCYWFYTNSEFKFKDRTVKRPHEFNGMEMREAFHYIGSELSRPVLSNRNSESYQGRAVQLDIRAKKGLPGFFSMSDSEKIAERKVTEFFLREGILAERWQLWMPCRYPHHINYVEICVPSWDKDGNKLGDGFDAGCLTAEQKAGLIGAEYSTISLSLDWDGFSMEKMEFPPMKNIHTTRKDGDIEVIRIEKVPDQDLGQTPEEEIERRKKVPKYVVQKKDFFPIYLRNLELVISQ